MMNKQLKINLIEVYNRQTDQRNKSSIEDWKAAERAHFLSLLHKEAKQTLLEIGAGHGIDGLFFKGQGLKVTGTDISPAMVELCRRKGIAAYVMDVVELSFEENSFDAVYALNSFLHLPKSEFPRRFFSLHTDEDLKKTLSGIFDILYFRHIPLGEDERSFQSVNLRNRRVDKQK